MKKIVFVLTFFCLFLQVKASALDSIYNLLKDRSIGQVRQSVLERLQKTPEDSELLLLAAKLSMQQIDFLKYYQKLLHQKKITVYQEEALFRMGQFYYSQGNYTKAIQLFIRLFNTYPDGDWLALGLNWLGYSILNQQRPISSKNLDLAQSYFTKLLTSTPSQNSYQILALMGLIEVSVHQGDYEKTLELLDIAFESLVHSLEPDFYLLAYLNNKREARSKYKKYLYDRYSKSFETSWLRQTRQLKRVSTKKSKNVTKEKLLQEKSKSLKSPSKIKLTVEQDKIKTTKQNLKKGCFIQLGLFSNYNNAKRLLNKHKNIKRLKLRIEKTTIKHKIFFLVRSISFPSKNVASKRAKEELKRRKIPYHIRK